MCSTKDFSDVKMVRKRDFSCSKKIRAFFHLLGRIFPFPLRKGPLSTPPQSGTGNERTILGCKGSFLGVWFPGRGARRQVFGARPGAGCP